MKRCVVAGGADIGDYSFIRSLLREGDFFIYCDSGLRHMDGLGRRPDLIIGDFDSHEDPHLDCETIVLPREKDDTDTAYAVKEAIRRGASEILLVGAAGNRQDHTLVNVFLLFMKALRLIHLHSSAVQSSNNNSQLYIQLTSNC